MIVGIIILYTAVVVANISFSNTINLGAVLVGVALAIGFAWAGRKDKRTERWEKLYDLADTERKEIQVKFEECASLVQDQKEIITKLDALQMPIKIVELMNDSVVRIDEHATKRMSGALEQMMASFKAHEERAQARHDSSMELIGELVKAVTQLSIRIENGTA